MRDQIRVLWLAAAALTTVGACTAPAKPEGGTAPPRTTVVCDLTVPTTQPPGVECDVTISASPLPTLPPSLEVP